MDEGKYQPQTDLIDIHEGVPPQKLGEIPPQTDLIQMDEGMYHPNQPAPRAPKAGEALKKNQWGEGLYQPNPNRTSSKWMRGCTIPTNPLRGHLRPVRP